MCRLHVSLCLVCFLYYFFTKNNRANIDVNILLRSFDLSFKPLSILNKIDNGLSGAFPFFNKYSLCKS